MPKKQKNYGRLKACYNVKMTLERVKQESDDSIQEITPLILSSTGEYFECIRLRLGEKGKDYIVNVLHLRNAIEGLLGTCKSNH